MLSQIAINETTGAPVTPGDGGPSITGGPYFTVTFCKSCPYKPDPNLASQFSFLYDYTDVYSSSSTFDQVDQVFWTVLWNPNYANSKTLFGIRRVTNFNSLSTDPLNGKWNLSVDYSKIQYYAWPLELRSLVREQRHGSVTACSPPGPLASPRLRAFFDCTNASLACRAMLSYAC